MSLITPDFGLLFWMVVIFGVVFLILAKFGFPIITKAVRKRSDHIAESLRAAEEARLNLERFAEDQNRLVERARAERAEILKSATEERNALISKAHEEASAEAAKVLQAAREEIEAERQLAKRELKAEVSALSVAVAEKIVRKELEKNEEQKALLDKFVDEAVNGQVN
ncbi:MAG: F0F1 ATP synthase subunit B [Bacteroidales bacterium]|nr:F0F1 ATP synthase subunit B [Bacteroidales bacterium]